MNRLNRVGLVFAILAGLIAGINSPASAQDYYGTVTLEVFTCPEGMTRDNYDPAACSPTADGVDLALTFDAGGTTLTTADAVLNGTAFTWSGLPVAPTDDSGEGDPTYHRITQPVLAPGYVDFAVGGIDARGQEGELESSWSFRLKYDQPDRYFAVYNFLSAPELGPLTTVNLQGYVCPAGFDGDYSSGCITPASGVWFRAARTGYDPILSYVFDVVQADESGFVPFMVGRSGRFGSILLSVDLDFYSTPDGFVSLEDTASVAIGCSDRDTGILDTPGVAGDPISIFELPVTPGATIDCFIYLVPAGGEEPVDDLLDVSIFVLTCDIDPGVTSPAQGNFPPETCGLTPGAFLTIESTDGTYFETCSTDDEGLCIASAPNEAELVITLDESTIPPAYAPRENPITTLAVTEFAGAVFVNLPIAEPTEIAEVPEPAATPLPVGRPAHIHAGTCQELDRDNVELIDLTTPEPEATSTFEATPGAIPDLSAPIVVDVSESGIDMTIATLLASEYAIHVHAAKEDGGDALVCGTIDGPIRDDGSIAIGLREVDASGYTGVAYLMPDPEDSSRTIVWLFVAKDLHDPNEEGTPEAI